LCGLDTYYRTDFNDQEIIDFAVTEKRVILTRDKGLLKNKNVTHGYWIRSQHPREQIEEIFIRFDLKTHIALFTRCMECNGLIRDIAKEEILNRLLPKTQLYYHEFKICSDCDRIYWNGSHYESMKRYIEKLILKK
jgi:uncharacterized protein with PIN domain